MTRQNITNFYKSKGIPAVTITILLAAVFLSFMSCEPSTVRGMEQDTAAPDNAAQMLTRAGDDLPGSLDTSFLATGAGARLIISILAVQVHSILVQSDGQILVCGNFDHFNNYSRGRIARLNIDGSVDTSFLPDGSGSNGVLYSLAIQGDGQILIGGDFSMYKGVNRGRIARINGTDGSLDTGFLATGTGASWSVYSMAMQNESIMIGGNFSTYNNISRKYIALLNADGSLDVNFAANVGTGPESGVNAVAVQSEGKILVGGTFRKYNGVFSSHLMQLNSDGTLDEAFKTKAGAGANGTVYAIALQNDGSIVIGGGFTYYHTTTRGRLARLNADGSLDAAFAAGTGVNNLVRAIALQPDGKILIAGDFTSFDGVSRGHVARLNADGSLDMDFAAGAGANGIVRAIALQPDGRILIAGDFTSFDGVNRGHVARLWN